MVTKWPLPTAFIHIYIPLQNNLCSGRYFHIYGFAFYHFHRFVPQEASKNHFVNIPWQWCCSSIGYYWICTNSYCNLHSLAAHSLGITTVICTILVNMPMHTSGTAIIFLQTIHTYISLAGFRVLGKNQRQGNKGTSILRPAFQNRELVQGWIVCYNNLLARCFFHIFREINGFFGHWNNREQICLMGQGNIRQLQDFPHFICHIIQLLHPKGNGHTLHTAKGIHQHWHIIALNILK